MSMVNAKIISTPITINVCNDNLVVDSWIDCCDSKANDKYVYNRHLIVPRVKPLTTSPLTYNASTSDIMILSELGKTGIPEPFSRAGTARHSQVQGPVLIFSSANL